MVAGLVLAICGLVWAICARTSIYYLLPVYLLMVAIDLPAGGEVVVFPDLGLGDLTKSAFKVGDVLLVATILLRPDSRRAFMAPIPIALTGVSIYAAIAGLLVGSYPSDSVIYLSAGPARLGLLISLFRSAGNGADRHLARSMALTVAAFFAPVAITILGAVIPSVLMFASRIGMRTADERIAFPGLGNNKIGLCLVLLATVFILLRSQRPALAPRALVIESLLAATLIAGSASLRFSTTTLVFLLVAVTLGASRSWAAVGLFATAGAVAYAGLSEPTARSLSVVTGDFDLRTDASFATRGALWETAVQLWMREPLFGAVGGWEFSRPISREIFRIPIETHSEPLWWVASFGLVGLAVLIACLVPVVHLGLRTGPLASVATGASILVLTLNAATFFPGAAATLALLIALPELISRSPTDVREIGVNHPSTPPQRDALSGAAGGVVSPDDDS